MRKAMQNSVLHIPSSKGEKQQLGKLMSSRYMVCHLDLFLRETNEWHLNKNDTE